MRARGLLSLLGALSALVGGRDRTLTLAGLLGAVQSALAVAMAVVGVLDMTGDWAHRLTTTSFPLVRSRSQVYAVTVLATLVVSALLLAALFALLCLGVAGPRGATSPRAR